MVFYEAISGLFDQPNSVVCGTSVARDCLHDKCKRVSKAKARTKTVLEEELDGKPATEALLNQASDPSFLRLKLERENDD